MVIQIKKVCFLQIADFLLYVVRTQIPLLGENSNKPKKLLFFLQANAAQKALDRKSSTHKSVFIDC